MRGSVRRSRVWVKDTRLVVAVMLQRIESSALLGSNPDASMRAKSPAAVLGSFLIRVVPVVVACLVKAINNLQCQDCVIPTTDKTACDDVFRRHSGVACGNGGFRFGLHF